MKRLVLSLCCVFLFSCAVQKTTLVPYLAIYSSNWVGNIRPSYIILRTPTQTFEIFDPNIYESIFGQWKANKDTLYLLPTIECLYRESELRVYTQLDTSIATIPQKLLIHKDCLIDITDYSSILPEPFDIQNYKPVYKRIKTAF